MIPRRARSSEEVRLHLDLTACEICGETAFAPVFDVVVLPEGVASRYVGDCPRCGTRREYAFLLPADEPVPDPEVPVFGGPEPSELIDAGEWLWVADRIAGATPLETTGLTADRRRQAGNDLAYAAAAVAEALRFVPAGADGIPPGAVWTERGRAAYEFDPARFRRGPLEAVRRLYLDQAARFAEGEESR